MTNYFDYQAAAKRYKKGRPDFHHLIVDKIKEKVKLKENYETCLDVACGTGLLTKALLQISNRVIGIDNSEAMLSETQKHLNIQYILGDAEDLKTVDGLVDLITVSSAFHWFNQKAFLKSSYQKLKNKSYIVIHNNFFTSRTEDKRSDLFANWMAESYLKKFVNPKKNKNSVNETDIKNLGFYNAGNDSFENTVSFTKMNLIEYLITQSNIITNVELGNYTIDAVKVWLTKELESHFEPSQARQFIFGNRLLFLRKE